ncbi:hypothetical protein B0A55_05442 [Friedmanniomyces simplex]|uniref:Uncharacterized protein n=1 Tax=Friedmanniomyces simplex TaxID=329884 RepID=A0A4U0XGK5_9PEZI|nr:hypothetical protein B0A55_05442 [Friedmanniomyces simplex]
MSAYGYGYGSDMAPVDDDPYDNLDPRHGTLERPSPRPGMMDPPARRGLPPNRMDMDPYDAPFSDDLYEDMLREHHDDPPTPLGYDGDSTRYDREGAPSPETPPRWGMGLDNLGFGGAPAPPGFDLDNDTLDEDEFLGQRPGNNRSDRLQGVWTEDFREQRPLLTEGFPSGLAPTARSGPFPPGRSWPGWNESMPEGAVGYIARGEEWTFGDEMGGPNMYPAEMVDAEFIAAREADPDWSPANIPLSEEEMEDRLHWHG